MKRFDDNFDDGRRRTETRSRIRKVETGRRAVEGRLCNTLCASISQQNCTLNFQQPDDEANRANFVYRLENQRKPLKKEQENADRFFSIRLERRGKKSKRGERRNTENKE